MTTHIIKFQKTMTLKIREHSEEETFIIQSKLEITISEFKILEED